jgi:hypothetical protein
VRDFEVRGFLELVVVRNNLKMIVTQMYSNVEKEEIR